jgi:hypothetical protein
MTVLSNSEFAATLRATADLYDTHPDLPQLHTTIYVFNKADLLRALKAIGGRFTKEFGDYQARYNSQAIPGLTVSIDRDKVCRKVVTWDCEPLLSDEEQAEVDLVASAAPTDEVPF